MISAGGPIRVLSNEKARSSAAPLVPCLDVLRPERRYGQSVVSFTAKMAALNGLAPYECWRPFLVSIRHQNVV